MGFNSGFKGLNIIYKSPKNAQWWFSEFNPVIDGSCSNAGRGETPKAEAAY